MFYFLTNEAYLAGFKKKKHQDNIQGRLTAKKKFKRKPSRKSCELTK